MDNLINALANARINETITGEVEQWRAINNYNGDYWNSSLGSVYSKKTEIIMKQSPNNCGYSVVTLSKNKNQKSYVLHRLVASVFIKNPNNYNEVDHIDGIKTNNSASNLRWVNHSINMKNRKVKGGSSLVYKSYRVTYYPNRNGIRAYEDFKIEDTNNEESCYNAACAAIEFRECIADEINAQLLRNQ